MFAAAWYLLESATVLFFVGFIVYEVFIGIPAERKVQRQAKERRDALERKQTKGIS